ncbi:hypothetical protein AKO1_007332 [Acrasis kona]|uniref:Uncharacterized protein n=1 Tax=Acrasis kona TaxID=1008807 RepID=A0AAW2YUW3_9EUKA
MTHPDMFGSHPEQQKINQQSLQLLQNFLDEYKGLDTSSQNDIHLTAKQYNLQWYIKKSDAQFDLIKINIKGPKPRSGVVDRSQSLSRNLSLLFEALGLPSTNVQDNHDFSDYIGKATIIQNDTSSSQQQQTNHDAHQIIQFLHKVHTQSTHSPLHGRHHEILVHKIRHKISDFLHASELRFDIFVKEYDKQYELVERFRIAIQDRYGKDTSAWGHKESLSFLHQDAILNKPTMHLQELKRLRDHVSDLQISLARGHNHIHAMGYICLQYDRPDTWFHYLENHVDVMTAKHNHQLRYEYLQMELMVAQKLKIHKFISENDQVFVDERYRRLLNDLLHHVDRHHGDQYKQVIVIVVQECNEPIRIHDKYGYLMAPIDSTTHQIMHAIRHDGTNAQHIHADQQDQEQRVQTMLCETKDYVGMLELECIDTLQPVQILQCCQKLVALVDTLKPLLHRKYVCISDGYNVRANGVIEIPHDF